MRMSDQRLGRFLSVDPLTKKYPWYTPYQFAGNMPIRAIDLDGAEPKSAVEKWSSTKDYKDHGDYYKNGTRLQKVEGYWVDSKEWSSGHTDYKWYNPTGGDNGKGVWQPFMPTMAPAPKSLFDRMSFVTDGDVSVTMGGQVGIKVQAGPVKLTGELNIGNVELVHGNANYNSSSGVTTSGANVFTSDEVRSFQKFSLNAELPFGIAGKRPSAGFDISRTSIMYNGGSEEGDWSVKGSFGLPLYSNSKPITNNTSKPFNANIMASNSVKLGQGIPAPKVNEGTFYGLDLGAGAKFILGVDIKLKVGVTVQE